jgi:hypothetical protein
MQPSSFCKVIGRENFLVKKNPRKKNLHLGSAFAFQIGVIIFLVKRLANWILYALLVEY